jgi:hypothetical protein
MVPYASTSPVHSRLCTLCSYSCLSASATTHRWLAATPMSLPGDGTVYTDIHGLIVLHDNMTRQTIGSENLHGTGSLNDPL